PQRRWVLRVSDAFTNRIVALSDNVESVTFDACKTYALEITPGACTHDFAIGVVTSDAVELHLRGACTPSTRKSQGKTVCTISPHPRCVTLSPTPGAPMPRSSRGCLRTASCTQSTSKCSRSFARDCCPRTRGGACCCSATRITSPPASCALSNCCSPRSAIS